MKDVIKQFKQWKAEHPDEDYQYDEIFEFVDRLGRGQMLSFLEEVEALFDKSNHD